MLLGPRENSAYQKQKIPTENEGLLYLNVQAVIGSARERQKDERSKGIVDVKRCG